MIIRLATVHVTDTIRVGSVNDMQIHGHNGPVSNTIRIANKTSNILSGFMFES